GIQIQSTTVAQPLQRLSEKSSRVLGASVVYLFLSKFQHGDTENSARQSRNQTRLAPEEQDVYSYSDHKPVQAPWERNKAANTLRSYGAKKRKQPCIYKHFIPTGLMGPRNLLGRLE